MNGVDVLAALDDQIATYPETGMCPHWCEVRAAVAELINSMPALIEIAAGRAPVSMGAIRRAEAALARVGGAK